MLFRKKSGFEKLVDGISSVSSALGYGKPSGIKKFAKVQQKYGWLSLAVPLIYTNREKIKNYAGTAAKRGQDILQSRVQAFANAAVSEQGKKAQQPGAEQPAPEQPQAQQPSGQQNQQQTPQAQPGQPKAA